MNLLLRALPTRDAALLLGFLVPLRLDPLQVVARAGAPVTRIVFPSSGTFALSLPDTKANGAAVGVIGREGMLGWPVLLGQRLAAFDAVAGASGGFAHTIEADAFERACAVSPRLSAVIRRFAQVMTSQIAGAAACTIHDSVARRLARWLLMLHDRQDGDELSLTHDALALELCIRRAGVTDCLHLLEGEHIVRCTRGRIVIRDRAALKAVAGAVYGAAEAEYRALIAPFGRDEDAAVRHMASIG